jgi:hypothetical protein
MKCIDKFQVGQQKKRVYEKELKTPFQRIIDWKEWSIPRSLLRGSSFA